MALWERTAPRTFSVVTGFFPEASPKATWATNPRPLLVCGTATDPETGMHFCRIAYGTSNLDRAAADDLVIGNLSMLNTLGLKNPTRFVIHSGRQMVIMPWIKGTFQPWTGCPSPVLGILSDDMRRHVAFVLTGLKDLPRF